MHSKPFRLTLWLVLLLGIGCMYGCETLKGVAKDVGNTARNLSDLLRLGKDIKDISR